MRPLSDLFSSVAAEDIPRTSVGKDDNTASTLEVSDLGAASTLSYDSTEVQFVCGEKLKGSSGCDKYEVPPEQSCDSYSDIKGKNDCAGSVENEVNDESNESPYPLLEMEVEEDSNKTQKRFAQASIQSQSLQNTIDPTTPLQNIRSELSCWMEKSIVDTESTADGVATKCSKNEQNDEFTDDIASLQVLLLQERRKNQSLQKRNELVQAVNGTLCKQIYEQEREIDFLCEQLTEYEKECENRSNGPQGSSAETAASRMNKKSVYEFFERDVESKCRLFRSRELMLQLPTIQEVSSQADESTTMDAENGTTPTSTSSPTKRTELDHAETPEFNDGGPSDSERDAAAGDYLGSREDHENEVTTSQPTSNHQSQGMNNCDTDEHDIQLTINAVASDLTADNETVSCIESTKCDENPSPIRTVQIAASGEGCEIVLG